MPLLGLALAAGVACGPAALVPISPSTPATAPAPAPTAGRTLEPGPRERVAYPRGECSTQWIEVEVFEPGLGWVPHPEHPRIRAGEVHAEETFRLLDLRVRCIDLDGNSIPSVWVRGVDVVPRPLASEQERAR